MEQLLCKSLITGIPLSWNFKLVEAGFELGNITSIFGNRFKILNGTLLLLPKNLKTLIQQPILIGIHYKYVLFQFTISFSELQYYSHQFSAIP